MFLKYIVACVFLNLASNVCFSTSRKTLTPAKQHQLLERVLELTDSLIEITPYLNSSLAELPSNCVQMLCKFVCFNGVSTDIELDIFMVARRNNHFCSYIEELRLYNYEFVGGKLSHGFLGTYSDKVHVLYIGSSNVRDVEAGAFANGIFKEIYFENLQLRELRKDFFRKISHAFHTLSIIQKQMPIQTVHADFLCHVKYLIKSLTLQAGLRSISNVTGGDCLLNNLVHTDFSHNDLGSGIEVAAFSRVSRLSWLDLSNTNLAYIPSFVFADFSTTLEYLDLSHNKLKSINLLMFGWQKIPRGLNIYAEGNVWSCSCELQREIKFMNLSYETALVCSEPAKYRNLSVFDDQICGTNVIGLQSSTETTAKTSEEAGHNITITSEQGGYDYAPEQTTELQIQKTSIPNTQLPAHAIKLDCFANLLESYEPPTSQFLERPLVVFNLMTRADFQVEIMVESSEQPYEAFNLIWFSKVASICYEMEINSNEYGLGCYKNISNVTSVRDLVPNTAYTFCLVYKQKFTISPFNCKSIYMGSNLTTRNSAWLTRDMKITGLVLFIIGIGMCLVGGILIIYLLHKHKPTLLRKNTRVTDLKGSKMKMEISLTQKTIQPINAQQEKLNRCGIFAIFPRRRKSNVSEASYESYIDANVYEVIPAFESSTTQADQGFTAPSAQPATLNSPDTDNYYLTPLESISSVGNLIQYADIPRLTKRNSNDVLPQLPASGTSYNSNEPDCTRIKDIYFLDGHV